MAEAKTKKVRIVLSALTRMEYTEVLEVPADLTDVELDVLVQQRYDDVDGGEYVEDPHFWEQGDSCAHESAMDSDAINGRVKRTAGGGFKIVDQQGERGVVTK